MGKYIPLDALMAWAKKTYLCENASAIRKVCYKQLVEHLNVLEVKEVDLQKEIDRVWDNTSDNFLEDGWKEFEDIAKHFFELGLRASNPLTWEDVKKICVLSVLVEIDLGRKVSDERHYTEVLKRFKVEKGERYE